MFDDRDPVNGLTAVRARVERVCGLLARPQPEVLDGTATLLEGAISELNEWRAQAASGTTTEIGEIRKIRELAGRARILLDKACAYHARWQAWLGSRAGGYQAGGEPAVVAAPGRVWIEG